MFCCASRRSRWISAGIGPWACLASFLFAPSAGAQIAPGESVPRRVYFNALPIYHDGDYRNALGAFLHEERGGIKTANSLWIDSICYSTMAGECYYQLGQLPDALKQYDAALKLLEVRQVEALSALYADLKGDVLVAQGRNNDARGAYQLALDKSDARSAYRALIQIKLDALGETK